MSKHFFTTLALLLIFTTLAVGQTINVERSKVLSHFGESEIVQLSLPIGPGVGTVARQHIKRSGASVLRLHFVVSNPAPAGTWAVQILDKNNQKIWSDAPTSATDFWTGLLPGDVAKVEVVASSDVSGLKLSIDRIIVSRKPTEVKSLTVNKLMSIDKASPEIQKWGKSVARLVFVGDGNGQFLCTGFLVAADLFMTNNHCIKTKSEMNSGLVEFDFDRPGAAPVTLGFKDILATSPELDFTLLRLSTASARAPFTFDPNSLTDGKALVIIQHPAGRPKQVSIENCKVLGDKVAGVTPTLTDFGHGCDTLGGSSGSAALDLSSGKVLGLHHLGFFPNNQPVNRAVRIQNIIDFLRNPQNLPDVAARQALGLTAQ